MTDPVAYLETIQLDLTNLTHLFALPESVWSEGRFTYTMREENGEFICVFRGDGREAEMRQSVPDHPDARLRELHRKRVCRRLCRQTCYALLRDVTGMHPPWGSMTGIRPTRLFYEALENGLDAEDAEKHLCCDICCAKNDIKNHIDEKIEPIMEFETNFSDLNAQVQEILNKIQ